MATTAATVHNCSASIVSNSESPSVGRLTVVSYNLHGLNQGIVGINELMTTLDPEVIMVQEHWLSSANLFKLSEISNEYFVISSSAMDDCLSAGPLVGRPYGGVGVLIKKTLAAATGSVICSERLIAVLVADWLVINVYMPCVGTYNRVCLYSDIIQEIQQLLDDYPDYSCLIGGDFNVDLEGTCNISSVVNNFIASNSLSRGDVICPISDRLTYRSESLNVASCIDYMLTSNASRTVAFNIADLDVNFSDHRPIFAICLSQLQDFGIPGGDAQPSRSVSDVKYFRWDHAPLHLYYEQTRLLLEPLLAEVTACETSFTDMSHSAIKVEIERMYNSFVRILGDCSVATVPRCKKNFLKFWWSQELRHLKYAAVTSARIWKDAGKPRVGPIFSKYQQDKLLYKKRICEERGRETRSFTNELHDALLKKSGKSFWKCWNSKFDRKSTGSYPINGVIDGPTIAHNFAKHFEDVCTPLTADRNSALKDKFDMMRACYHSPVMSNIELFDVQLLSELIAQMEDGKAAGLDDLSCEHLKYCHPIAVIILCKLFNMFTLFEYLPRGFGLSYTVPVPKCDSRSRTLTVDDFRGISISPVISKLFEMAILNRYSDYLQTSDNQFGFKKHLSCRHAIYCVRTAIEHYTSNRSTVNACSLDLTKAFDKMNHFALFIKLMERNFPSQLLNIFIQWFQISLTCVRWDGHYSFFFRLLAGVRQGGVLSPYFFAIFIDDIVLAVNRTNVGCYISGKCVSIILYADDIILIAPSVEGLQKLLTVCEKALVAIDMQINVNKSKCLRFGARYNCSCAAITLLNGDQVQWTDSCRYLGVYFVSAQSFRCSFHEARASFYRACNGIFGKVCKYASEDVALSLVSSKCLPILLYATEACPLLSRDIASISFAVTRVLMKIFHTRSSDVINECCAMFGMVTVEQQIHRRKVRFLQKFIDSENSVCTMFARDATSELTSLCV